MARDVICMGVRLQNSCYPDALVLGGFQVLLDCIGGIDHRRLARPGIADQVGGTAEIVVDELAKDHEEEANTRPR